MPFGPLSRTAVLGLLLLFPLGLKGAAPDPLPPPLASQNARSLADDLFAITSPLQIALNVPEEGISTLRLSRRSPTGEARPEADATVLEGGREVPQRDGSSQRFLLVSADRREAFVHLALRQACPESEVSRPRKDLTEQFRAGSDASARGVVAGGLCRGRRARAAGHVRPRDLERPGPGSVRAHGGVRQAFPRAPLRTHGWQPLRRRIAPGHHVRTPAGHGQESTERRGSRAADSRGAASPIRRNGFAPSQRSSISIGFSPWWPSRPCCPTRTATR